VTLYFLIVAHRHRHSLASRPSGVEVEVRNLTAAFPKASVIFVNRRSRQEARQWHPIPDAQNWSPKSQNCKQGKQSLSLPRLFAAGRMNKRSHTTNELTETGSHEPSRSSPETVSTSSACRDPDELAEILVELRGLMRQHFAHIEELTEERRQRANRGKAGQERVKTGLIETKANEL
jgi:hypothetical protein